MEEAMPSDASSGFVDARLDGEHKASGSACRDERTPRVLMCTALAGPLNNWCSPKHRSTKEQIGSIHCECKANSASGLCLKLVQNIAKHEFKASKQL